MSLFVKPRCPRAACEIHHHYEPASPLEVLEAARQHVDYEAVQDMLETATYADWDVGFVRQLVDAALGNGRE